MELCCSLPYTLSCADVTSPSQLLTDFMNQTVAILAYHEIPDHFYTQVWHK